MTASHTQAEVGPTSADAQPQRAAKAGPGKTVVRWLRRVRPYQWLNLLIIAAYLAMGIAGITTSNLGSIWNRQSTPGPYPDMFGPPQDLRSDEFWVGTPLSFWYTLGLDDAQVARMSATNGWALGIPSGPAQVLVLWDKAVLSIGRVVGEQIGFALQWWLPSLLLVLFLPSLFSQLGARRRYGYVAAALILVSPAQTWWSMQPSGILGPTVAGCVAMFAAYRQLARGQWAIAIPQALVGGILLSNLISRYPIWVLLLTGPVLAAVVGRIFVDRGRHLWAKLISVGVTGVTSLALALLAVRESAAGMQALAGTVYPAARRTGAAATQLYMAFGAPFLRGVANMRLPGTNISELSTSFNILILVALIVLGTQRGFWRDWRTHLPFYVLAAFGAFELGWGTLSLGWFGQKVPLLNMIPPERAVQVAGFLGIILLFMLLSRMDDLLHRTVVVIAAASAWLTGYAGSLLQSGLAPMLSTYLIWAGAAGVGVAVYVLLRWPRRIWPLVLATTLAAATTIGTFPVQVGLGDFRNSSASQMLLAEGRTARADGSVWVSDQMAFDALFVATGVPSLSGMQRSGPDRTQWAKLDPSGKWEESWNRGAGYVRFTLRNNATLAVRDNGFDVVQVTVDPCELARIFPNLSHVVSRVRLTGECMRPVQRVTWARERLIVYEVTATEP